MILFFRTLIAKSFRFLFTIPLFKKYYFAFYTYIFKPTGLFKNVIQLVNIDAIKFKLHIDDWIQQNLYFLNQYEKIELDFLKKRVKEGSVFVDIGANIGLFSLTASKLVGNKGSVISFEPFSKNYDSLHTNISLNRFTNIQIEQVAIGDTIENTTLYYNEKEKNFGMVSMNETDYSIKEKTTVITLDSYVTKNKIDAIDFIKIDIEGNEFSALNGMKTVLTNLNPILLIEILTDVELKQIVPYLKSFGYKKYYLTDNSEVSEINTNLKRQNYIFKK